jgi:hypothetical protein
MTQDLRGLSRSLTGGTEEEDEEEEDDDEDQVEFQAAVEYLESGSADSADSALQGDSAAQGDRLAALLTRTQANG